VKLVSGHAELDDVDDFLDSLNTIGADHGCTVQAVDARYVAGRRHLTRALELADRALDRDDAIARDRGVELLLYVAGTRQIDRAFEIGVSTGRTPIVVVVDAPESDPDGQTPPGAESAESIADAKAAAASAVESRLDPAPFDEIVCDRTRVQEWFDIGDTERDATTATLQALVCERVALLALET
jgi:KEOPS complex subunit Cgi121